MTEEILVALADYKTNIRKPWRIAENISHEVVNLIDQIIFSSANFVYFFLFYLLHHGDEHHKGQRNDCGYGRDLKVDIDAGSEVRKKCNHRRVRETELDNSHEKVGKVGHTSELLQRI